MATSSCKAVPYDLRPSKQAERLLLLDTIRAVTQSIGISSQQYSYIGFGGNKFYDFLMAHKYLGINKLTSLEHDANMHKRAKYSKPYEFIDVRNESMADYLKSVDLDKNSILWLDYDGVLQEDTISDISALGSKLQPNDFFFITLNSHPISWGTNESTEQKVEYIKHMFGEFANTIEREDVTTSGFKNAIFKIIDAALKHTFATKSAIEFYPFFSVAYSDNTQMVTYGGCLLDTEQIAAVRSVVESHFPFLSKKSGNFFEIKLSNLSPKERMLFDLAATSTSSSAEPKSNTHKELNKLGFDDDEVLRHKELLRYIPRYVETLL